MSLRHLSFAVWVIYRFPSDFPNNYVVRPQCIDHNGEIIPNVACTLADSLEQARTCIPRGKQRIERSPFDDPVIVETWI